MTAPLELRAMEASEADLVAFEECFERNGTRRRIDALRWQYLENPTEELFVELAVAGERIAGIYAVQPALSKVRGARILAAQSVDTLVDADFRGRGLFTKTAEAVYQRFQDRGGAFVYGFPNANSAPGFFGKLGWSSLNPVPFLVKPLSTAFIASKLPFGRWLSRLPDLRLPIGGPKLQANQELRVLTEIGPELDELWRRFASGMMVAVDRSTDYLRWRLAKPADGASASRLRGRAARRLCAYTTVDKRGGRIRICRSSSSATGVLVRSVPRCWPLAQPYRVPMGPCGAGVQLRALTKTPRPIPESGSFHFPEKLRPHQLHLGVRPLDRVPR